MERKFILFGLLFVTLGIGIGAFAAHGLKSLSVTPEQIESFRVGVDYLFYSGLGLMVIGAVRPHFDFIMKLHFRMIVFGTVLFCGSIFLLTLLPLMDVQAGKVLGPITPIGGLMMILGWFTLFVKYLRQVTSL
jgi:uncharacterized membrane protein YgdD (TMEM256/DUF423 family)